MPSCLVYHKAPKQMNGKFAELSASVNEHLHTTLFIFGSKWQPQTNECPNVGAQPSLAQQPSTDVALPSGVGLGAVTHMCVLC